MTDRDGESTFQDIGNLAFGIVIGGAAAMEGFSPETVVMAGAGIASAAAGANYIRGRIHGTD